MTPQACMQPRREVVRRRHASLARLATLLMLCCGPGEPVAAETRPLVLRTQPAGARITENGVELATTSAQAASTLALDAAATHVLALKHPSFDELRLELRFDPQVGRWMIVEASSALTGYLQEEETLFLPKTLRIQCTPGDAEVLEEVLPSQSPTRTTLIFGKEHCWKPLPRTADGKVTLARACAQQTLLLSRPLFADFQLIIDPNALADGPDVYPMQPVRLDPRYGPLSYGAVQLVLAMALVGGLLYWRGVWLPKRRRAQEELARQTELAEALQVVKADAQQTAETRSVTLQSGHVGATVSTEAGSSFVLMRELGRGGKGAVFEACGDGVSRPVDERWAIKLLFDGCSSSDEVERFRREVIICSRLMHPGIVKVYDSGVLGATAEGGGSPFIVMELVQGETLGAVMRRAGGPLAVTLAVGYLRDILAALKVAHAAEVIHRDLKPDNLMVTPSGHVKILDFGLAQARAHTQAITKTGTGMGTPRYMSPEHFDAKRVTPAADIYSLGVIAYEMLAGRPPFEGDDAWALITQMMTSAPPLVHTVRDEVPEELSLYVACMLVGDVDQRFPDASVALAELEARRRQWEGRA